MVKSNNKWFILLPGIFLIFFQAFPFFHQPLHGIILGLLLCITICLWAYAWQPHLILLLVFLAVPFEINRDVWGTITAASTEILLIPAFFSAFFYHIRRRSYPAVKPAVFLALLILFLSFIPSLFNAQDIIKGIKQLIRLGEIVFAVYLGIETARNQKYSRLAGTVLLMLAAVESLWALFQMPAIMHDLRRISGSFSHHNMLGIFLVFAACWGLSAVPQSRIKKILLAVTCIGILISLYWSGAIGIFCTFLILLSFTSPKKSLFIAAGIILFLSIGLFIKPSRSYIKNITRDPVINNRLIIWQDGLKQFKQHPFIGHGIGNYRTTLPKDSPAFKYGFNHAHSLYIHILVEGGLCALGVCLILIGLYLFHCLRRYAAHPDMLNTPGIWLCVSLSIFFISSFFDFLLGQRGMCALLGATLGASITYYSYNTSAGNGA